jgi:AcrR family transcriptional regulator
MDGSSKRDATRQRLMEAANARFRTTGYRHATAAMIAEDAGVTERTFFRYFPTKAAVLLANWEGHSEALRAVLASSEKSNLVDVVRDALVAFTDRLQAEIDSGLDSVVRLYTNRASALAILQMLVDVETDVAVDLARRSSRRVDDLEVRVAANASLGIFRASVRAYVTDPGSPPISEMVTTQLRRLRPIFTALQSAAPATPVSPRTRTPRART